MIYIADLLFTILAFILTTMHPGLILLTIWFIIGIPTTLFRNIKIINGEGKKNKVLDN